MQGGGGNPPVFDGEVGPAQTRRRLEAEKQVETAAVRGAVDQQGVVAETARGGEAHGRREHRGTGPGARSGHREHRAVAGAAAVVSGECGDQRVGVGGEGQDVFGADASGALPVEQTRLAVGYQEDSGATQVSGGCAAKRGGGIEDDRGRGGPGMAARGGSRSSRGRSAAAAMRRISSRSRGSATSDRAGGVAASEFMLFSVARLEDRRKRLHGECG